MIKVSVILPVYGVSAYVEKCTRSLLAQTLNDIEFIFVDDHTPDDSIEKIHQIVDCHEKKESFVFLKPKRNIGAGMARNYAMEYAKGEYIAFVDSDDTIDPTMFEDLYNEAQKNNKPDMCYCQAYKDYEDGQPTEILKNPIVESGNFTREKKSYFLQNYVSLFWTFIYKREFLQKHTIRYPEERSADDSFFVFCSLALAESIAHVDKPFYHYLIRPGSVTTSKVSDKYKKRLATFGKLLEFAKTKGIYNFYKNETDYIYIKKGYITSTFSYMYNTLVPEKVILNEILDELKDKIPDYEENPLVKKNCKVYILMFLLKHFPWFSLKILPPIVRKSNMVL